MTKELIEDFSRVGELSLVFERALNRLGDSATPRKKKKRRKLLRDLSPAVSAIAKLFYVAEEDLEKRSEDRIYLLMRLHSWYLELSTSYFGGVRGLSKMAQRVVRIQGRIQSRGSVSLDDLAYLRSQLELLLRVTGEYSSLMNEIDLEASDLIERYYADRHRTALDEEGLPEANSMISVVLIYGAPVLPNKRRYFIVDPTLRKTNLLGKVLDDNDFHSGILEGLFEGIEEAGSLSVTQHYLEVQLLRDNDWDTFDDNLEALIRVVFSPDETLVLYQEDVLEASEGQD